MALVEDFETTIKIIVVGNGGVGKSSMIRRFCTGEFTDKYKKTIGVDFLEKEAYVASVDQTITFMVWDTAGQEEFNALTRQYYRNANGCVLAFSSVDRDSFNAIESWKSKVEDECGSLPMVLVQNKVDLIDKAVVTSEEVETLAMKHKLKLYRTCVSENLNVDNVFKFLGEEYVNGSKAGGESGTGAAGLTSISDIGTTLAGKKPDTPGAAPPKNDGGDAGVKSFTGPTKASKEQKKDVVAIEAKPKQRTGGKKKFACAIL